MVLENGLHVALWRYLLVFASGVRSYTVDDLGWIDYHTSCYHAMICFVPFIVVRIIFGDVIVDEGY